MARNSVEKTLRASFFTLRRIGGHKINISRGGDSVTVIAVPSDATLTLPVNEHVYEEVKTRTWLVLAEELKFSGSTFLPERNDVVTENGRRYELLPFGEGVFDYEGPGFDIIKMYGKEIL